MVSAKPGKTRVPLRDALAGLEAGVLGTLVMLGFLMLGSIWLHRSVWSIPNLMATAIYGPDAYRNQFVRTSLAGAALMIVLYGVLGALWGIAWKDRQSPLLYWAGAATGFAVYALFFGFIWKHARPLLALYAPDRQLEVAHMLWGLMLARSPRFSRNISALNTASADAPPSAGGGIHDGAEFRSGEVIL